MSTQRRSQRATGVKPEKSFEDITTKSRQNTRKDKRTAREVKHAGVQSQVTFFNLLPRLRLRVYHYAIGSEHSRELRKINVPTLAMVSKQVRAEVLRVFFSECTFEWVVWSSGEDAEELDGLNGRGELPTLAVPTLSMKLWAKPRYAYVRRDYGIRVALGKRSREI
ncbi:hypothetical protein LTR78_003272 [Recurvomyces mirabilis]|uniref:Uncharacterized protein n=1 Tax=Recurvomyces mirabilis TaxID=574656 RepID=A0AAE0WS71_9PEZI|nr:hypothetical protein LTR78_003272 [Recurvomyces mirabilis]KAK5156910.1 hypothetical protein LTS14_004427 [Recurvomyces mirabilis]